MDPLIATGTMLKAPVETVRSFVHYHLNLGVDYMFLYFDDPSDPAFEVFREYPNVFCIKCTEEFWGETKAEYVHLRQQVCLMDAVRRSRDLGIDWLFHIDSDELLYFPDGLKEIFCQVPEKFNTVRVPAMEAIPESLYTDEPFLGSSYFRYLENKGERDSKRQEVLLDGGEKIFEKQDRYFRGHMIGKAAVRIQSDPVNILCHAPVFPEGIKKKIFTPSGSFVLHYESNSFPDWKSKMDRWIWKDDENAPGRMQTLMPQIRAVRDVYRSSENDTTLTIRLEDVYREFYFISPKLRTLLYDHNMLRIINLPRSSFSPPD